MPIWRDPFDDLIADLERSVPASAAPDFDMPPPIEDVCMMVQSILTRDPAEKARLADDPRVKAVEAYHARLAQRLNPGG